MLYVAIKVFGLYILYMEQKINIQALLEWYINSGIDVLCGDNASLLQNIAAADKPTVRIPENTKDIRPAITRLAQATPEACKNARQLCENTQTLEELRLLVENFEGCALKFNAKSTVFGAGNPNAELMIIGEAPGADEDRIGKPFVGRSGQLLEKMLNAIGLKREDVYITNILPWRPPGNRTPTDGEVAVCLPFLKRQIDLIRPKLILLLGGSAANAVLDNAEPISRLRGHWLDYKSGTKVSIPALASFHPAFLLRNSAQKAKAWNDFLRICKKLKEN